MRPPQYSALLYFVMCPINGDDALRGWKKSKYIEIKRFGFLSSRKLLYSHVYNIHTYLHIIFIYLYNILHTLTQVTPDAHLGASLSSVTRIIIYRSSIYLSLSRFSRSSFVSHDLFLIVSPYGMF